jgi:hypothetical protein
MVSLKCPGSHIDSSAKNLHRVPVVKSNLPTEPRMPGWIRSTCRPTREQEFCAGFERLGLRHEELESVSQTTDNIKPKAHREGIFDLRARGTRSQYGMHIVFHGVLARQLVQHAQRRPQ